MTEVASGIDVLDSFKRLAEINDYLRGHFGDVDAILERDGIAVAVAREIVGHRVIVEELPDARERRRKPPIEKWSRATPAMSLADTRTYWGTSARFLPNDVFRYHRRSRGKVAGVDGDHASLIVRPRITGILDRDWIKVADGSGEPLVDLTILD